MNTSTKPKPNDTKAAAIAAALARIREMHAEARCRMQVDFLALLNSRIPGRGVLGLPGLDIGRSMIGTPQTGGMRW